MKSLSLVLFVLLVSTLAGCATDPAHWFNSGAPRQQSNSSAAAVSLPSINLAYKKYELPNGLTLIVHEDHKSPVAALDLWYHVGSKDEPEGRHGYAHLFEHLISSGSEHHDDDSFKPLQADSATDINDTTSYDRTGFSETVPTPSLELSLWSTAERMSDLPGSIDQSQLDEQRGLVENQLRRHQDRPYADVDAIIAKSTYPPGHPYSWTPLGSIQDLNAARLSDARDWLGQYYGAANATLVISGDVNAADIKAKVERYFSSVPSGSPVGHVTEWTARMSGDRRGTVVENVPQARLYLVWNLPPAFNADTTRLVLAAAVLANGKDSRLYKLLVHDKQSATDVSATVQQREIGSQLVISADARAGVPLDKIEQAIDLELAKLLANGPQPAELDRVRVSLMADVVRQVQPVMGQAELLARSEVYGGSPDAYQDYLKDLRSASANEVRDSLRNWLTGGVFVLDVQPTGSRHVSTKGVVRRPPLPGTPSPLKSPTLQRTTLSNGMQVLLAQGGAAPLVDFDMIFGGGRASDSNLPSGTAALTYDLLSAGTGQYGLLDIDSRLQALGASFDSKIGPDYGDVRLSALKTRLQPSLDVYAALIRQPAFAEDEIARYKQRLLASIAQQKASPDGVIKRVLTPLLFGPNHPYSYVGLGLAEQVQTLQRDDLVAYAQRWLRPDNATLLVTGDIDMATLKPLLEARFGGWQASAVPVTQVSVPPAPAQTATRVFLIDKPYASQSVIVAANLAPPPSDPQQPAFDTVNAALAGHYGSRLNRQLRDDAHSSYGAFSGVVPMRSQQIFYAGASVEADRTAQSITAIRAQINAVANGQPPLTDAEINAAKQAELHGLPGADQALSDVVHDDRNILTLGLSDDYYRQLPEQVEALTAAQLQTAAQRLIHPAALTWVIVGDLSKIEQPVRALNLGTVQVIDADGKVLR